MSYHSTSAPGKGLFTRATMELTSLGSSATSFLSPKHWFASFLIALVALSSCHCYHIENINWRQQIELAMGILLLCISVCFPYLILAQLAKIICPVPSIFHSHDTCRSFLT